MTEKLIRDAKAFAAAYEPADTDHPDLQSRVVMFNRAVDGGNKRVVAVHARTLMRFVGNLGMDTPAGEGPTKAELQAEAESLGLSKSGSKAELQARIDEHHAAQG